MLDTTKTTPRPTLASPTLHVLLSYFPLALYLPFDPPSLTSFFECLFALALLHTRVTYYSSNRHQWISLYILDHVR